MCSISLISSRSPASLRKFDKRGFRFMRDKIIIDKMLRYTDKICAYCEGMSYEEFRADDMLVEACVFNLGQIGELTARLGQSFKQENAQVA